MKKVWIGLATAIAVLTFLPKEAQAGTATYYATCEFTDKGNNNGGNVLPSPCMYVNGGNGHGAFWQITWSDGVVTSAGVVDGVPNGNFPGTMYRTKEGGDTTIINSEGDVIKAYNMVYQSQDGYRSLSDYWAGEYQN